MMVHEHSEPRRPDRVVVLGANGFLGQALLERLAETGIEALALCSRELDLSSAEAPRALAAVLRPTDSIVMLAATKSGRQLDDVGFVANAAMGAALCSAVRERGCSHLVYVSSDAVYPFTADPVREDSATAPTSLYALMHLARETMLTRIESAPLAVLRVTQVYGPGDPHGAYGPSRMIRSALQEGRIVLFGSGEETRDHIGVRDVASVILDVLRMRSRGLVNVATGRSVSFAALADFVARVCGGPIAIQREPRRIPVLHRMFDISVLQAAFPARMDTSLETGLAMMVDEERRAPTGPHVGSSAECGRVRADAHREGPAEAIDSQEGQSRQGSARPPSSVLGRGRSK